MAICKNCGNAIPDGFRFCGICGTPLEEPQTPAETYEREREPLPPLEEPVIAEADKKTELFLIKGANFINCRYIIQAQDFTIGRIFGSAVFPKDRSLSPLHARVFSRDGQLYVRDENSLNGVFVRIKKTVELKHGDTFIVGQQWIRFEAANSYRPIKGLQLEEGTKFYGSPPEKNIYFRLVHLFKNNVEGAVFYAFSESIRIGRENCDLSFPTDRHISGRHARVYEENGRYYLQDLGSKNGTFIRITDEYPLETGDTFFVGQQLFRVD